MDFEELQYRLIEHMDRGHRQFSGVELSPGVAAVAVQHGLQIYLTHLLENANEDVIYCHQFPGVVNLNLVL